MKKITLISFLFLIFNLCIGQEKPSIKFVSNKSIVGTCNFGSTVYAKYIKADGTEITDKVLVSNNSNFVLNFSEIQKVGNKGVIWSTFKKYKVADVTTDPENYTVLDDTDIINVLVKNASENKSDYLEEVEELNYFNAEKEALKNTTLTYATTIWSTNFNIPLIRFNLIKNDVTKKGDVLIFNSIGAGIGRSWGHLERTRDNRGEIVNEEFSSTFGIHLGALFSAGTGEDIKNVFAPTFNLSVLDFQIGVGYELGSILPTQKREFITLSYAIPLYKLFKRSYRLSRSTKTAISSSFKTQN